MTRLKLLAKAAINSLNTTVDASVLSGAESLLSLPNPAVLPAALGLLLASKRKPPSEWWATLYQYAHIHAPVCTTKQLAETTRLMLALGHAPEQAWLDAVADLALRHLMELPGSLSSTLSTPDAEPPATGPSLAPTDTTAVVQEQLQKQTTASTSVSAMSVHVDVLRTLLAAHWHPPAHWLDAYHAGLVHQQGALAGLPPPQLSRLVVALAEVWQVAGWQMGPERVAPLCEAASSMKWSKHGLHLTGV